MMGLERLMFSAVNGYWRVARRIERTFYDSISSTKPFEEGILNKLKPEVKYHVKVNALDLKLNTKLGKGAIESLLRGYFVNNGNKNPMSRVIVRSLVYEWQIDVKHRQRRKEIVRNFGLIEIEFLSPEEKGVRESKMMIKYQEDLPLNDF